MVKSGSVKGSLFSPFIIRCAINQLNTFKVNESLEGGKSFWSLNLLGLNEFWTKSEIFLK